MRITRNKRIALILYHFALLVGACSFILSLQVPFKVPNDLLQFQKDEFRNCTIISLSMVKYEKLNELSPLFQVNNRSNFYLGWLQNSNSTNIKKTNLKMGAIINKAAQSNEIAITINGSTFYEKLWTSPINKFDWLDYFPLYIFITFIEIFVWIVPNSFYDENAKRNHGFS
jgi:hypothetical protein